MVKKIFVILALSFLWMYFCNNAYATNGFKTIGVGAINEAMGGAGVAVPEDTNTIIINPAGLSRIGSRWDISLDAYTPSAHMDTSLAPLGNAAAGEQESGRDTSYIPTAGISYQVKDSPWSFGFGLFGLAGCGVDYVASRISTAYSGNLFDKYTDYTFMTAAPAAAYRINDKFSLGFAGNIDFSTFKSDVANSLLQETQGAKRKDHAFGGGFSLGFLYDLTQRTTLGFSYTSRQWMQKFSRYPDSVPRLDMAPEMVAGIGIKITDNWTILTDFKWIDWNAISLLRKYPSSAGFGWKDQYIFAIGSRYSLTPKVILRMGYNYSESPIANDMVFANALFPAVAEHHAACGVTFKLSEKTELHLAYDHAFKNTVQDTGLGDSYSANGKGTKIDISGNAAIIEWSVKF